MENLSSLVAKVYPGRGREELAAVRVFGAFMRALSPRVLQNARPMRFARGVLTIHTVNSAWASSLQLESESILARITRLTPGLRIAKLVFRSGPLPDAAIPIPPEPPPKRSIALDKLPEDIARALAQIHNDALREAVARAALVGLAE
jgi:hypothetical protein